jgi:hypothetical protein
MLCRCVLYRKAALTLITVSTLIFLLGAAPALTLDPSLEISQYGHTAWTARDEPYTLLVTRDGTLRIGTFAGLVSWNAAAS